jgi:SHS2 domain-containing protein
MPYELLDHTADLGLSIRAAELSELFETAATALGEQLVDVSQSESFQDQRIRVSGEDWADLLINWLRELLVCWHLEGRVVTKARCVDLSAHTLTAEVSLLPFDSKIHTVNQDIKAVTYHQLEVVPTDNGWKATVIFDL